MSSKRAKLVAEKIVRGLAELADALENDESLAKKFTCRKVILDLKPIPYSPKTVKSTRKLLRCSQAVFAHFLGVSPATVQAWEQGRYVPENPTCRLMDEIQRDPEYWRNRLHSCLRVKQPC
jgi:putative transcriptional regulator